MKNSKFFRTGTMIAAAMLVLVSLQSAFAAGTRAGTLLTSTATINYNDKNGSAMSAVNGSVSVYVAHRPASTLAISTSNSQGYDGGYVVYTMQITNNGNGQDVFQILSNVTSGATYLDSIGFYKDVALTQGFTRGTNKHIMTTTGATPDTVSPDAAVTVYAKVYLKSDPDSTGTGYTFNGNSIVINFIARSTANMTDTTYNNADASGPRAVAASFLNALSSGVSRSTLVKQSKLTLTLNRGQAGYRPGSTTGYNATISNSGYGRAESVVLTVTYAADQTYSAGTGWSAGAGSSRTFPFGTIAANGGSSTTASTDSLFLLLANLSTVLEGTTRTPTLSVTYNDSTNGKVGRTRVLANSPQSFNVLFKSFLAQTDLAIVDTVESADPGDTVTLAYTITNNSNGQDGFNVRYRAASQGTWTGTKFWYDVANAGFNAADDSLFAGAGGGADVNTTKYIARGASITIYIRTAVPSSITTSLTHLEHQFNSRRDSVNISTDFNLYGQVDPLLPNIIVSRSKKILQAVAGDTIATNGQASIMPGDSVTIFVVIENTGDGQAKNVVISDDIANNANMTNVSNSAYIWDTVTGTEAVNSDHVTIPNHPTTAGTLYGNIKKQSGNYVTTIATMNAGEKRQVKYTLKVN
ncbi:MAG: hypothetical protein ACOYNS_03540 [Bacteroidota bacterium]